MSPRETEAAAFGFVNRLLEQDDDPESRMRGLVKNQQLWSLLLRDVGCSSNGLPDILKADLIKLGLWVLRHTIGAMGSQDASLTRLVEINEDMIAALRASPVGSTLVEARRDLALAG